MNGKHARYPQIILNLAKEVWKSIFATAYVYLNEHCFYDIKNINDTDEAIYRMSYLAKVCTKHKTNYYTNRYGMSQIYQAYLKTIQQAF